MVEEKEKKVFPQTKTLSEDEVIQLIKDADGRAVMVDKFPENTKANLKILAEPELFDKTDIETGEPKLDDDNVQMKTPYFLVEVKFNDQPIPFKIRTSWGAYKRWDAKIKAGKLEYIGQHAFFTNGKATKKYQSISIPLSDKGFVNSMDKIREAEQKANEPVFNEETSAQDIMDWVVNYKVAIDTFNESKTPEQPEQKAGVNHCILKYLLNNDKRLFDAIKKAFETVYEK